MGFPVVSAFVLFWVTTQVHLSVAASCTQPGWEWSHNLLRQDPCAVVQIIEAKCKNLTSYYLEPLEAGTNYMTPQAGTATGCSCNTVTYSLYQACSQCQIPNSGNTWYFYQEACTEVYVTLIPLDIPGNTKVPPWAYLDVTEEDNFNLTVARALAENPGTFGTPSSLAMSSDPADPTSAGAKSRGVIIGGVVGGVTATVLSIALYLFYSYRKNPQNKGKVVIKRDLPQMEESLLSPGPLSPPTITRDLPRDATYRELSRSGVISAYDSSFYPKNVIAPSQNGYHGFAEV